ncbi:Scn11a [Symbiodinium pilosum]|uniref:Scn11a protein n=1 Tax=Symbiodinium pilosum TaxID=2952 RepID=A0A812XHR3_SYMPI|nr:Scn11a [Symbiodinium pilosum]
MELLAPIIEKCTNIAVSGTLEQRVSVGVAVLTLASGLAHFLQGIIAPKSCAQMCLEPWFMTAAGLWMTGSGLVFLHDEQLGFPFMASAMGGAAATALLSPMKPGVVFSLGSLAAQAYTTKLPQDSSYFGLTVGMFTFGILGRVLLNHSGSSAAKED